MPTTTTNRILYIKPRSKRNALFLLILGALLLSFSFILNSFLFSEFKIQLTLIMLACFMVFLVGLMKYLEPKYSYCLTPTTIRFIHRHGQWQLPWSDIVRIGTVAADVHGQHQQLPYLGIKLINLESIANSISPRLANKLMHEQQELLRLAKNNNQLPPNNETINFSPYSLQHATYKGPVAAWLYRSEQLAQCYGFHLFIPQDSFDRDRHEFLALLKQCKQYTVT